MYREPYRMIVVGLLSAFILGAGLLFYYFIFPKKKPNSLVLLILISFLPLISILRPGSYESGDLSLHVKFAMQFFDNLKEGNIIPEWIKSHCSGYGCPVYIFLFMLPYYLISFFHLFGIPFLMSAKLLMILSYIISGIGMYFWMKDEFGEKPGFVAAIFYLFAPYHLIDLSFRVSIGELVSMAILPFLFFCIKKFIEKKQKVFLIFNAILFCFLILSHQVTSLISLPLLILYSILVWYRSKKKNFLILAKVMISLFLGILLTTFYWLPILAEGKFTKYGHDIEISFHPITSFLYSSNRFGLLFQGHMGELYFNIGYVQWIIIALGIYLFLNKKLHGKNLYMMGWTLLLFVIFFFMMQSISKPIWLIFPLFKDFEFAWRLMIEIILFVSVIVAIIVKTFPNKIFIILLCTITVMYTVLNWGNRKTEPTINDTTLRNQLVFVEHPGKWGIDFTSPIWVDEYKPWIGKIPKQHIEVVSGKAKIVEILRLTTQHEYVIAAQTDTILKENTYYFPGWKIFVNNKEVQIDYKDKTYPGIMMFKIKKGLFKVDIVFTDTLDRKIGKWTSTITAILLFFYALYIQIKKKMLV